MENIKKYVNDLDCKSNRLKRLDHEVEACKNAIINIGVLRHYAGTMLFVGKSGKIGDNNEIASIRLNDIGGCVEIPLLIEKLATERLKYLLTRVCECGNEIDENMPQCLNAKMCETCLDDKQ